MRLIGQVAVIWATIASIRSLSASIDADASAVAFCSASFNRCSTVCRAKA